MSHAIDFGITVTGITVTNYGDRITTVRGMPA